MGRKTGFEFKKLPTIKIDGKDFECDITNRDMMEGISEDWPKIIQIRFDVQALEKRFELVKLEFEALMTDPQKNEELIKEKLPVYKALKDEVYTKIDELIDACQAFIKGCLGINEYIEIFGERKVNVRDHFALAQYIYNWALGNRGKFINQKLGEPIQEKEVDFSAVEKES